MKPLTRYTPVFVSFLFVMGLSVHLTILGQYVTNGHRYFEHIMSPMIDGVLFAWMAWCAVLLTAGARAFFAKYQVAGWRKPIYWLMTVYVIISLPGHIRYLVTLDTSYFENFPWWSSAVLLVWYVGLIAFLLTLKPRENFAPQQVLI